MCSPPNDNNMCRNEMQIKIERNSGSIYFDSFFVVHVVEEIAKTFETFCFASIFFVFGVHIYAAVLFLVQLVSKIEFKIKLNKIRNNIVNDGVTFSMMSRSPNNLKPSR